MSKVFRHFPGRLATALCLLTLAGGPADGAGLNEAERLQFANGLYARDMHALAIREYTAFLEAFPKSEQAAMARFRLANSHDRLGNAEQALREFAAVFRDFPKSEYRARAGFRLADLQRQAGRHKEAAHTLQDLVELELPEDMASASWYALGASLLETGQHGPALKTFERVRRSYPNSAVYPLALLQLANLRASGPHEDIAEAETLYAALIEKPPSARLAAEALYQRAGMQYRRGAFAEAARAYRTLLERYPQDDRAREARLFAAWAAYRSELFADALALTADPPAAEGDMAAEWLYVQANSERQLLKNAEAADTYARLLRDFPNSPFAAPARLELAVTLYRLGRYADAIAQARAVTIAPEIAPDVYWLLAESHAALKQAGEAVQFYRRIVERHPKNAVAADAAYRLARLLRERKNLKEAARYYGWVAEHWPASPLAPTALFAAAACRAESGLRAEAVRDWAALIEAYPDHPLAERAYYQKAMNEIRMERDREALATLETLRKRHPKTAYMADAYYWQGLLLANADKPADAERMFRQTLQSEPRDEMKRDATFRLAALLLAREEGRGEAADLMQELLGTPGAAKLTPGQWQWLAEFRFDAKAYDQSLAAARALIEAATTAAQRQIGWTLAGRAQRAKDDATAARASFARALKEEARTPFLAEAALRLGELTLAAGNHEEATAYLTQAAEADDEEASLAVRARAYAGLGRAAQAAGRLEEAARFYLSVAILYDDPDLVPECLAGAAAIFEALRQPERARQIREELNERFPNRVVSAKPDP